MKRAHLSVPPSAPAPEAADLTDRLLDGAKSEERKAKSEKRKAEGKRQKAETPLNALSAPSVLPSVPSVDTALAQSRAAIESLRAAAGEAPARYQLGLRYRLDALAHHLAQIAEFVEQKP